MISRYFVIVLALGATAMQASQSAWVEAAGLAALAGGLILLQLAVTRPALKPLAWVAFSITALSMVAVFMRTQATG